MSGSGKVLTEVILLNMPSIGPNLLGASLTATLLDIDYTDYRRDTEIRFNK